jgi:hypothetical protein
MPLTQEERGFLDAYVYEATHEPFGGPATDDLRRRGIRYADLHGLLTGYHREATTEGVLPFGKANAAPPPSPWENRQQALDRSQALLNEHAAHGGDEQAGSSGKGTGAERQFGTRQRGPDERIPAFAELDQLNVGLPDFKLLATSGHYSEN